MKNLLLNIFSPKFQVSHWCYLELYVPQVHSLVAQMSKHLPTTRKTGFNPWVRKIPWRRKWQPTPVLLPGKSHGWRRLVGYSPWGHNESDTTERLHSVTTSQVCSPFQHLFSPQISYPPPLLNSRSSTVFYSTEKTNNQKNSTPRSSPYAPT